MPTCKQHSVYLNICCLTICFLFLHSSLSVGDLCLAKFDHDGLWYKATIVDTHGDEFLEVMYDDYGEATHAVERENVIPLTASIGEC